MESQQVTFKEKLPSNFKGRSEGVHLRCDPGRYQEPDASVNLFNTCFRANKYLLNSLQIPSLYQVLRDMILRKTRQDTYPPGTSSLVGLTEKRQVSKYLYENNFVVSIIQRLTGHQGTFMVAELVILV